MTASGDRLPTLPERKALRDMLRTLGFSSRQSDAIVRACWREVVGIAETEAAELRERLEDLENALKRD